MCGTKITDSYVPQTKIGKYVLSFSYFLLSSLNIFDCKCSLNYSKHEVETYLVQKRYVPYICETNVKMHACGCAQCMN